jgi:signal transduction histidine kinase
MSATPDELRASVARIMRGTSWSVLILLAVGAVLHLAGVMTLSPLAGGTALLLLGLTRWQARLVDRGEQPQHQFVLFHVAFAIGITVIIYALGGIRFPAGALFYMLLVANSGFVAPIRYLFANLSAALFALVVGLEQLGILPRTAGAFPIGLAPVPPWPAQLTFVAALAASLNLLAAITNRLIGLLDWSRQRLAHANLELDGWRQSLADQVRERTRELEAANRQLDERARALQDYSHRLRTFVYTVTHDLKTPVNNVVLLSDLLLARDGSRLGEEGRHDLERIARLAGRTEQMIRDLFALFQITSAREDRQWVALEQVARRVVDDLAPQITARGLVVRLEPLPRVWAAPGKLQHVVGNLVANAIKHVPPDTGEIVVGGAEVDDRVQLWVRDNGIGIAPEYHEGIFKLFGRVPGQEHAADGTGVGLAIVRGLVEEHQGRVWVESTPGAGSTFYVELPAGPAAPSRASGRADTRASTAA